MCTPGCPWHTGGGSEQKANRSGTLMPGQVRIHYHEEVQVTVRGRMAGCVRTKKDDLVRREPLRNPTGNGVDRLWGEELAEALLLCRYSGHDLTSDFMSRFDWRAIRGMPSGVLVPPRESLRDPVSQLPRLSQSVHTPHRRLRSLLCKARVRSRPRPDG